ncbi:TRAP transporter substrate-binding protein [Clostridium sp. AN503]|uniref:TRAP transporter substrate-binding protein n=1 Tax=Clostridium sp. AN503 TaxID=3160598 RepID=UPI0034589141
MMKTATMKTATGIILTAAVLGALTGCTKMSETTAETAAMAAASDAPKGGADADTAAKAAIKLIGAHVNTTDSSYQAGFEAMKEKLEEISGETMTVEIHPNGELGGNEAELVEKMATGTVDMIVASPNFVATTGVKEADLFSIPFLYTGLEHWNAVVDGEVGQAISGRINAAGTLHSLGYWSCGTREYFGVKAIHTLEDLKNVKIRVQDSDAVRSVWSALGANPTTLAYNELYSGLQNNVIDAAENDLGNILLQKFYEAGPYVSLTDHDIATRMFLIGAQKYNGLTDEQRAWVDEAAEYACVEQRKFDQALNNEALEQIKANGGIVNEVDKESLIAACADARETAAEKLGAADLYQMVNEAAR